MLSRSVIALSTFLVFALVLSRSLAVFEDGVQVEAGHRRNDQHDQQGRKEQIVWCIGLIGSVICDYLQTDRNSTGDINGKDHPTSAMSNNDSLRASTSSLLSDLRLHSTEVSHLR